ncbi:hypothetical protein BDQ94DRAFT_56556 [Aspergillus welwitschiae]|uniref:Uncharacterized protein n=1 Tax=Aspergillus welwitschiae TaxID=1341132 RepID=A0A3F3PXR8_9EURO|nr:hypothetical protein BDQ94DRAFT_56556 [Aspergillus welwitschiae]RDH31760.1 hypothetical protein BDQ94DRAFT_56556 [Aspergillus welwitschiae]
MCCIYPHREKKKEKINRQVIIIGQYISPTIHLSSLLFTSHRDASRKINLITVRLERNLFFIFPFPKPIIRTAIAIVITSSRLSSFSPQKVAKVV